MKLWQKNTTVDSTVDCFTIGHDREMDRLLAHADIIGSIAHAKMLQSIGLLTVDELKEIEEKLKKIDAEPIEIEDGVEDIHSQIEFLLGDIGKKIHSGRSRNDQVLVDLKLFMRHQIYLMVNNIKELFDLFQEKSEIYQSVLMPGYTHTQIAMPSSFGLWFGAYAESLVDDCEVLLAAYKICNKNPLGSAAGYGSSFPLDRKMTTELLGFEDLNYNVVYAQMGRGKSEKIVAQALSSVGSTISRFAGDNCLFMCQNFGFVKYPDALTTGSSIMPHKKNPDVWELVRAKCNTIQALPNTITMVTTNLPLGYNRDLQLLKELLFPAIEQFHEVLEITKMMLRNIIVNENILVDKRYDYLFSVESVNRLVLEGIPFREAYKVVGESIEKGDYHSTREVRYSHEGSIGNLCNKEIAAMMDKVIKNFNFEKHEKIYFNK